VFCGRRCHAIVSGREVELPYQYNFSGNGSKRIFVSELHSGKSRVVQNGRLLPDAFLDIGGLITEIPQMEDGLLSLPFLLASLKIVTSM
jgi:hypothetical protein